MESRVSPLLRPYLSLFLIVPKNEGVSPRDLGEMVREVNHSQLQKEEILSDRVYEYDKERGKICQVPESIKRGKEMER